MTDQRELSLRERKKARTRKAISDAATELFAERGFDAVTIEDVAAAADVTKRTVFNYFRCKEDLFFDEADEARERLVAAVRERPAGEPVAAAMRRALLAVVERMCEGERPWVETMTTLVTASPSLRGREGEIYDGLVVALAEVLRDELGADEADSRPFVAAQALVGVHRSVMVSARRRVLAGERGDSLAAALRRELDRGFAFLADGMPPLTSR